MRSPRGFFTSGCWHYFSKEASERDGPSRRTCSLESFCLRRRQPSINNNSIRIERASGRGQVERQQVVRVRGQCAAAAAAERGLPCKKRHAARQVYILEVYRYSLVRSHLARYLLAARRAKIVVIRNARTRVSAYLPSRPRHYHHHR